MENVSYTNFFDFVGSKSDLCDQCDVIAPYSFTHIHSDVFDGSLEFSIVGYWFIISQLLFSV